MDTLNLTKLMVSGDMLEQEVAFETGKYLLRFDERLKMFDIFSHPTALEKLVRSEQLDVWAKIRSLEKANERNEILEKRMVQMQNELRVSKAVQDQQKKVDFGSVADLTQNFQDQLNSFKTLFKTKTNVLELGLDKQE